MDKQKLEEAGRLADSMICHPVAFGTIDHTEQAGEMLRELLQEVQWLRDAVRSARADEAHCWARRVDGLNAQLREVDARYMALLKAVADGVAMQPRTVVLDMGPNVI